VSIWASSFTTRQEWSDEPCPPQPLDYQGSHVIPETGGPRRGHIDCAELPCHVRYSRDHPDSTFDADGVEPFLRLSVERVIVAGGRRTVTQILDADTATALRDYLTDWLERSSHPDSRSAEDDSCPNCDGRKCMACASREVHDECAGDCPECCADTPAPAADMEG